ncbi:MAG TPA: hypothetical protein VK465_08505 [Fibrobacteria bacterium]|nr:hypothetical protein [Fibrobacteria bacterium]
MSWEERNRDLLERSRAYVLEFKDEKPPVFENFAGGADPLFPLELNSDRGVGLLLFFSALCQNISEERLVRVLAYLWKQYGTDMFRLNRLAFDDLHGRIMALTDLHDWPLWTRTSGVLRSVGDFFFKYGPLVPWVYAKGDGEACVEVLCEEIFMMGKTSAFRGKARHFLWMLTQIDSVEPSRFWTPRTRLAPTLGHGRFLREFGPLKGRKSAPWTTPEEKLDFYNRYFRMLYPSTPWVVFLALDAFMKPQPGYHRAPGAPPPEWQCRKVVRGCPNCPLAPECPGRDF